MGRKKQKKEEVQDPLRNPNDFLKPNEQYMIMGIIIVRQSIKPEDENPELKEFDVIIHKLRHSFMEWGKPADEPRIHQIEEDGEVIDVQLSIPELYMIEKYLSEKPFQEDDETTYPVWTHLRHKILGEILNRD